VAEDTDELMVVKAAVEEDCTTADKAEAAGAAVDVAETEVAVD
jgi:hypothetical protein